MKKSLAVMASLSIALAACSTLNQAPSEFTAPDLPEIVGTDEPWASEAIYFVLTDRFVDGDPSNNQRTQGGEHHTFDRPLMGPNGERANVGYQGGDFKGILNNAEYIYDMGFSAVWLSPIVDNPDEAFRGGDQVDFGVFGDKGKTGYHGYWASNFYQVDEHWPSSDLDFKSLTRELKAKGLKTVLDVVANHGSPSYDMPQDQPKYGEIYDENGRLLADHQNIHPTKLTPDSVSLHEFFHPERDPFLMQLSNFDESNPELEEYLVNAYLKWIDQGADAFRLDTVVHMPEEFWARFSQRIREQHPGFFMFGEVYRWEAEQVARYTHPAGGGMSVLDFPGRKAMVEVFEDANSDFSQLAGYLHLDDDLYQNPYDLMTFYDNHDMSRMNASDAGFIDANNWLFTSRGIPVVYYGSETGFMRGTIEHKGNRNYFGQSRIDAAPQHDIYTALKRIANLRKNHVALQRGVQRNLSLSGDQASFLRVYQKDGVSQIALVLLNKGDDAVLMSAQNLPVTRGWKNADNRQEISTEEIASGVRVSAHGAVVLVSDQPVIAF